MNKIKASSSMEEKYAYYRDKIDYYGEKFGATVTADKEDLTFESFKKHYRNVWGTTRDQKWSAQQVITNLAQKAYGGNWSAKQRDALRGIKNLPKDVKLPSARYRRKEFFDILSAELDKVNATREPDKKFTISQYFFGSP